MCRDVLRNRIMESTFSAAAKLKLTKLLQLLYQVFFCVKNSLPRENYFK